MPRNRILQTSFTSGELDPRLLGRVDIDQYHKGVQTALNVISIPHGGLSKRLGTQFVSNLPTGNSRLIRFEFSTTQGYLFVLKAGKLYIYRDGTLETNLTVNGTATTESFVTVPYAEEEVVDVDFVQSFDTLIMVHPNHPIRTVTRGDSNTKWNTSTTLGGTEATLDFGDIDYSNFTFTTTDGGSRGSRTLTSSSAVFNTAHVGGSFRTSEGFARITAVGSSTSATINIIKDLDSTVISGAVSFPGEVVAVEEVAWSVARGYPASIVFHENRLWLGGTRTRPQTVWASVTGQFFNFELGEALADEAISFTIATDQVNSITHLVSDNNLQIFTTGGGFYVRTSQSGPITPSDFSATRIDTFGSKSTVKPLIVDAKPVYINADDGLLRTVFYDIQQDKYATDATSILSPQVLKNPIDMEALGKFGEQEGHYLLVTNEDGTIACLSTLNTEAVRSWTRLTLAEGLRCVGIREVENVIYLEVTGLVSGFNSLLRFAQDTYTDGNVVLENQTTTITGLDHLNGHEVRIIADNYTLANQTVSGGELTLSRPSTRLEIGIGYGVSVVTMPVAVEDALGIAPVELKRIAQVEMRVDPNSRAVKVNGDLIPDRTFGEDVFGLTPQQGTSVRRVTLLGYGRDTWVTISQDEPFPFLLLAITLQIYV